MLRSSLLLVSLFGLAEAEAAEVAVESAGQGEKVALRYTPAPGAVSDLLTTSIATTSTILGKSMASTVPKVATTVDATLTADGAGRFRVAFAYRDTKVDSGGTGMGGMIGKAIQDGLAEVKGEIVFTPVGDIVEAKASLSGKEGDESFDFAQWIVRFPDEPVGVGARWTVTDDATAPNGIVVKEKRTYTLVERGAGTVKLVVESESAGTPGSVTVEGMKADVTKLTSKGTGTLELRLDRPLPASGTQAVSSTLELAVMGMPTATETRLDVRVGAAARR